MAVYNVEDFFFSSHQDHQCGRGNSQFLGEGGSKDGVVVYRWQCSEDYTEISSAVVFAKNLQLAPSSLSGRSFFVESPRTLFGRYQALRCYLQENHLQSMSVDSKSQPRRPVCLWTIKVILLYHVFFSIHVLFLL